MSKSPRYHLEKKAKQGFRGYPVATVIFYGPTADHASKVAVAAFRSASKEPAALERYFTQDTDARFDPEITDKILAFLECHGIRTVAMTDTIFGCPHEEGIDYPDGSSCPKCPYWAGRDRGTLERIH